jgi:hypothetical protein
MYSSLLSHPRCPDINKIWGIGKSGANTGKCMEVNIEKCGTDAEQSNEEFKIIDQYI